MASSRSLDAIAIVQAQLEKFSGDKQKASPTPRSTLSVFAIAARLQRGCVLWLPASQLPKPLKRQIVEIPSFVPAVHGSLQEPRSPCVVRSSYVSRIALGTPIVQCPEYETGIAAVV